MTQAIKRINKKYFCIIDGDDCWLGEYKIEKALKFLEKNLNFIGWTSDALQVDTIAHSQKSYIHDVLRVWPKETVVFNIEAPFFQQAREYLEISVLQSWD